MKIKVTQTNIDLGERGCAGSCPVALAFKDAGFNSPRVGLTMCNFITPNGDVQTVDLSCKVIAFIHDFDNKRSVQPFECEINYGN